MQKTDLTNRADIEKVIKRFYEVTYDDDLLGPIFKEIFPLHLPSHIPIVVDFWESNIFYTATYKRNVMTKHIDVNQKIRLTKLHFERWAFHFQAAVDYLFEGPLAEKMKENARLMTQLMEIKMRASEQKGFIQ